MDVGYPTLEQFEKQVRVLRGMGIPNLRRQTRICATVYIYTPLAQRTRRSSTKAETVVQFHEGVLQLNP